MVKARQPWETSAIQSLLNGRFPDLTLPPDLNNLGSSSHTVAVRAIRLALAKIYREELEALSSDELKERLDQPQNAAREQRKRELETRERAYLHNQTNAQVDYDYWARMTYWTPEDAVALSFGKDPREITLLALQKKTKPKLSQRRI